MVLQLVNTVLLIITSVIGIIILVKVFKKK